jgi:hypothetical protein
VLGDLFPNFKAWYDQDTKRRERQATMRANNQGSDRRQPSDWTSIFDAGDQAIQEKLSAGARPRKKL